MTLPSPAGVPRPRDSGSLALVIAARQLASLAQVANPGGRQDFLLSMLLIGGTGGDYRRSLKAHGRGEEQLLVCAICIGRDSQGNQDFGCRTSNIEGLSDHT